jgi:two-component system cell cycle response regulator
MTSPSLIRILLVQTNPDYAAFVKDKLSRESQNTFHVKTAASLQEAQERLLLNDIDLVLLELFLPDSQGLETYERIQLQAVAIPVIILSSMKDELTALRAVQRGAQDYLLKAEDEGKLLPRAIRCAVERQRVKAELMTMSFMDDLTGLYNRRGFCVLSEQHLKLARRNKKGFLLFLADLDGFKQINDYYGHAQGDAGLRQTAALLRRTFRQSDILARIGGDEFAMIAIDASPESAVLIQNRLETTFDEFHFGKSQGYKLSLSAGVAHFNYENPVSFEQLFETADALLYQNKRARTRR